MYERCFICNKKNLMVHKCKCGISVCMRHRYPDEHACTFNYHVEAEEKLKKQLVKVVHPKIVFF